MYYLNKNFVYKKYNMLKMKKIDKVGDMQKKRFRRLFKYII